MESLSPLQKAWLLLSNMNGKAITKEEWNTSSEYAKKELKRKCLIVIDNVLNNCKSSYTDYWIDVKTKLNNI
jgi:hypothetical protein